MSVESEDYKNKSKIDKVEIAIHVVYAVDPEQVACLVMSARGLRPEQCITQVGVDDGQGLLKIMLSVKEKHTEDTQAATKKSKYEEGFAPKDFKYSGVKKLILLLVAPSSESYENMSALLGELGMDAVDFGFCCDLKMVLLLLGKQAASSKHCCPYCNGSSPWTG